MFETDVSRPFKAMQARLNSTHKEKGNVQLTPSEVRKLRTILLSTSSHPNRTVALEGLKFYTMILLGISNFFDQMSYWMLKFMILSATCK
jgi:hypothetical protein